MIYDAKTLTSEAFDNISIFSNRGPMFEWCMKNVLKSGHLMEFGVYVGHSINYLADLVPGRTFHGFDSFEGLPEAWSRGDNTEVTHEKGHFALKELPKVRRNVALYKGWFKDSLPTWMLKNPGDVAFIHNDSDLYSSTIFVLEALNDRIVPGTIILFDELIDWFPPDPIKGKRYPNWPEHEWKALKEWLEKSGRKISLVGRTTFEQAIVKVEV